jgi:outer membrane PBP1 activator LpoA protein
MWFDNRNDPTLLKAGVKDWQTRYPQNPGAKMLPTALVNMQNYKPASTNKIALLLPLNGQAASSAAPSSRALKRRKTARRPLPEAPFLPRSPRRRMSPVAMS